MPPMQAIVAGEVWHYWISWALVAGAVLAILGVIVGYLVKVQSPKYPRR